jgi:hypothetical protein
VVQRPVGLDAFEFVVLPGPGAAKGATVTVEIRYLARALRELIAALDRRVPRLERADEAGIARDAAALRARALTRLAELHEQDGSTQVEPSPTPNESSRP